ncbi:hypothetical protein BGZ76_003961 [Entomortierella beljakovae]|nr:hypothetical protein BGZ76_003961 [Entomortierella beljakovae]
MKYVLSVIVLPILAVIASAAPIPGCLKGIDVEAGIKPETHVTEKTIASGNGQHPGVICKESGFPGGPRFGYPGFGYPGFGYPGFTGSDKPDDAYAYQLPANTMGSGKWANKNEVRPRQEGIFAKILKGAL